MSFHGVTTDKILKLKEQHLAVFDTKRNEHRGTVSRLYKQFIAQKGLSESNVADSFAEFYNYFAESFKPEIYSGYSTQFVRLDENMQNAVIERAKR